MVYTTPFLYRVANKVFVGSLFASATTVTTPSLIPFISPTIPDTAPALTSVESISYHVLTHYPSRPTTLHGNQFTDSLAQFIHSFMQVPPQPCGPIPGTISHAHYISPCAPYATALDVTE